MSTANQIAEPLSSSPVPPDPRYPQQYAAGLLYIDRRAQRAVNDERVANIARGFDWSRFEAPTVVIVGGRPTVIEGQHRVKAVQSIDKSLLVWCMVLPDTLGIPSQAQLALDITKTRRGHTAYEKWVNALHAEHPHEVLANEVLEDLDLRIGRYKPAAQTIACVATVRSIVHGGSFTPEDGAELLRRTLKTIMAAWPIYDDESSVSRWDRNIMIAIAEVHRRWWDEVDADRLAGVARVRPAAQWISIGGGTTHIPPHVVLIDKFVAGYNKNLRGRRLRKPGEKARRTKQ